MQLILIMLGSAIALFAGMLVLQEIGRRIGVRRLAKDPDKALAGSGAIEGSIFGLLGLLIAFTFSGAASRFDSRRQLVVQEANAIGTAYLRLDLLPADAREELRGLFRKYTDSRIQTYRKLPDITAARAELSRSQELQNVVWTKSVAACRTQSPQPAAMLLLPALNEMIDITTTRTMAGKMHPPLIVFAMLFALAMGCSLLAGYGMADCEFRSKLHMVLFAAVTAVTVYVIIDIEYPRQGLFRVDASDQVLVDVRESMK